MMGRDGWISLVIVAMLIGVVLWMNHYNTQCQAKGGEMVPGVVAYKCVVPVKDGE